MLHILFITKCIRTLVLFIEKTDIYIKNIWRSLTWHRNFFCKQSLVSALCHYNLVTGTNKQSY